MLDLGYRSDQPIEPLFHSHTYYEVYYFHEGQCNYLIGDRIYTLAPGDLIIMYGMTLHCAKINPAAPYIRTIIHFEPSMLQPYLDLPNAVNVLQPFQQLKNYRLRLRGKEKAEIERQLERMNEYKERQDIIGENRLRLAFVDLLYTIYEHCMLPMMGKQEFTSDKEASAQKIISLLEVSYTDDLHLEQLEEKLHMSRSYISKLFKEVTGVTVFNYVYRRRINEAKIMFFLQPELSVTEICFRLGFKHLAHFSRLFKQYTGMTPEQFKKSKALNYVNE